MPQDTPQDNAPQGADALDSPVDLGQWTIGREWLQEYLESVGDPLPIYQETDLVPALAISARALGRILVRLQLPEGAIHSIQEIETLRPVHIGEHLIGQAEMERPRQRGNLKFMTVSYRVSDSSQQEVQRGKSTVLITQGPAE